MANFTIGDKPQASTLGTGAFLLIQTGAAGQYGKYAWQTLSGFFGETSGPRVIVGTGNPNNFITAVSGSLFVSVDTKLFWMNLSGGNSSWV